MLPGLGLLDLGSAFPGLELSRLQFPVLRLGFLKTQERCARSRCVQLWTGNVGDVHGPSSLHRVFDYALMHLWLKKPMTCWFSRCSSLIPVQSRSPKPHQRCSFRQ